MERTVRLAINIDHVATLRQARGGTEPDPIEAALLCERAGAEGIVCHLREDRRHVQDRDVYALRKAIKTKLDLEMAAVDEIIQIALDVKPDFVTLVPEKRRELTTESGLNIVSEQRRIRSVIETFHRQNIPVSLFLDPIEEHIHLSREIGADMVEIHTGEYANATGAEQERQLERIKSAARLAASLGLGVHGGHGLNYANVFPIAAIHEIDELSIGHSIIARAVFVGIEEAVRSMKRCIQQGTP
jgi:pyridoxine 5-phosphate synthase